MAIRSESRRDRGLRNGDAFALTGASEAPSHAQLFFNRLIFGGQTLASFKLVIGANHTLQDTTAGANEIVSAVNSGCVQH